MSKEHVLRGLIRRRLISAKKYEHGGEALVDKVYETVTKGQDVESMITEVTDPELIRQLNEKVLSEMGTVGGEQ